MATLVDDLLELAGADTRPDRSKRPAGVRSLIEASARRAERSGHKVEVDIDQDPSVLGDFDALARMVWILVHNATTHGSGTVEIGVLTAEGKTTITVADRGPGIPEDGMARVFERFYRADPARSPAGAGLGLAIAQSIVDAHGGQIELTNRDGGGVVATVTLPTA
jgi:two-component system OmpR family sensor kinase